MAAVIFSSNSNTQQAILSSAQNLPDSTSLACSKAIIATSTFFYCSECGKVNLTNFDRCGITATSKDLSFSLKWKNRSIEWETAPGAFRVIFYLDGKTEIVKEGDTIFTCAWPNRLIRMFGDEEFHQLKKIKAICKELFPHKPTLDMVQDGPVILTSCKSSVFVFGVKHRTDPHRSLATLSIFSKGKIWYLAWRFTGVGAAPIRVNRRVHLLKASDWTLIAQLLGDTHPKLVKLPQILDIVHDSTGES